MFLFEQYASSMLQLKRNNVITDLVLLCEVRLTYPTHVYRY